VILDGTGQPASQRIQPHRGSVNTEYLGAVGAGAGTLYWLGRGVGAGYGIAAANFDSDVLIRELRSWAYISTAQAGKTINTYLSNTSSPASATPTHTSSIPTDSTGWVQAADSGPVAYALASQIWLQTVFGAGSYAISQIGVSVVFETVNGLVDLISVWHVLLNESSGTLALIGVPASGRGLPLSHEHPVEATQLRLAYGVAAPAGGTSGVKLHAYRNDSTYSGSPFFTVSANVNSLAWRQTADEGSGPEVFAPGDELNLALEAVKDPSLPPPSDAWTVTNVQSTLAVRMKA